MCGNITEKSFCGIGFIADLQNLQNMSESEGSLPRIRYYYLLHSDLHFHKLAWLIPRVITSPSGAKQS